MSSIPVVFRQLRRLYAVVTGAVCLEIVEREGWAHGLSSATQERDNKNWLVVLAEYRKRNGVEVGTGYSSNPETE